MTNDDKYLADIKSKELISEHNTLHGHKHAVMERRDGLRIFFDVREIGHNEFEIWCTHGGWSIKVDEFGLSLDDFLHFEIRMQLLSHTISDSDEMYYYDIR